VILIWKRDYGCYPNTTRGQCKKSNPKHFHRSPVYIKDKSIDNLLNKKNQKERINRLFNSGLPDKQRYIEFYFGKEIKILDDKQIIRLAEFYNTQFENLCIEKANYLRRLVIEEYAKKIQGLSDVALRSIFSFRFDDAVRKVETQDHRALTVSNLNRTKSEIREYKDTHKSFDNIHQESYDKLFNFIDEHIEFSTLISRKKRISYIKYKEGSTILEPKSWLYENIRYAFPKQDNFPINNTLISWFLYNDTPNCKEISKLDNDLRKRQVVKRIYFSTLLMFNYRISKLTIEDFKEKGIDLIKKDLDDLRQKISYIIYYFIFSKFYSTSYVSNTTSKGQKVGKDYWTPEYFVIRAVFFAIIEANNGKPLTFKEIKRKIGFTLERYIYEGYGIVESYNELSKCLKNLTNNRPKNSDIHVFKNAQRILEEYSIIYYARHRARKEELGEYDSDFERDFHDFLQKEVSPLFIYDKPLIDAIGKREIISKDRNNNIVAKKVHNLLHYDFYLKLTREIRKCLGLDKKWKGIAVEGQSRYWHEMDDHIKRDKFKQTISTQENIILINIWYYMNKDEWLQQFRSQLEAQTGIEISQSKINNLKNYFGKS